MQSLNTYDIKQNTTEMYLGFYAQKYVKIGIKKLILLKTTQIGGM